MGPPMPDFALHLPCPCLTCTECCTGVVTVPLFLEAKCCVSRVHLFRFSIGCSESTRVHDCVVCIGHCRPRLARLRVCLRFVRIRRTSAFLFVSSDRVWQRQGCQNQIC